MGFGLVVLVGKSTGGVKGVDFESCRHHPLDAWTQVSPE
jgi:hypothetical protein